MVSDTESSFREKNFQSERRFKQKQATGIILFYYNHNGDQYDLTLVSLGSLSHDEPSLTDEEIQLNQGINCR